MSRPAELRPGPEDKPHSAPSELFLEFAGGAGLEPGDYLVHHLEDHHLAAHIGQKACELASDDAPSHDPDPAGALGPVEGVVRTDDPLPVIRESGQLDGYRAGGEDHMAPLQHTKLARAFHFDPAGAREATVPLEHFDLAVAEQPGEAPHQAVDDPVLAS